MYLNELEAFCKKENNFLKIKNVESKCLFGRNDLLDKVELTICIPTYKREKTLKEAIDSALSQKNANINYCVVVVDNDPDLEHLEILKLVQSYNDSRLLYYKNLENIGMFNNWNRCFQVAKSRWVALLHDDDLLKDDYIQCFEKLKNKMERKSIKCLCFAYDILYCDERKEIRKLWIKKIIKKIISFLIKYCGKFKITKMKSSFIYLSGENPFSIPSCGILFDRNNVLKTGGFNDDLYPTADFMYIIYLMETQNVYFCHHSAGIYRWEYNESLKPEVSKKFIEESLKQILFFENKYKFLSKLFHKTLIEEKQMKMCNTNKKINFFLYLIRKILWLVKLYSDSVVLYK